MIGICTDSNSQLPAELARDLDVEVVPIVVTIDGVEHAEGVDLDADGFYAYFGEGSPEVTTSQPAPGVIAQAYQRLVDRGCDQILSIHVTESMSGTIGAAKLAAELVDVPVRIVDSGIASFGITCCVLAAATRLRRGATLEDAAAAASGLAPHIGTAFVVGVPGLLERGGRAAEVSISDRPATSVLAMRAGELSVLGEARSLEEAVSAMRDYVATSGASVAVAIGRSDATSAPLAERLRTAVGRLENVRDVIDYRIGPSVGAHTGPGTAGLFVWPV